MNKTEKLEETVFDFFMEAADAIGEDAEYVESLLAKIDFVTLHHTIQEYAQPVYRYSCEVDALPDEEYLGERLLARKAIKIWSSSYSGTMIGTEFLASGAVEVWIQDDMELVIIASHIVDYEDFDCISVYREIKDLEYLLEKEELDLEDITLRLHILGDLSC